MKGELDLKEIPIWEKMTLTIEETSAYSGIGEKTLRNRIKETDVDFVLKVGTKTLIKRKLFERYLNNLDSI